DFQYNVVSLYETVATPTVRKTHLGDFARDGSAAIMVKRFSSQLFLPSELRVPVNKTHTEMVKFDSAVDPTFLTVVDQINNCISHTIEERLESILSMLDPGLNRFLSMLSYAVYQRYYKAKIRRLDHNQPEYYWIFRNMDFTQWYFGPATHES
ncbi:hypothetical protein BDD12DRAFT_929483, partial [Trichophaea hybrida]